MRPHKIHESSSRCERLEEAEELDTSEEPLFLREPFTERRDLLSISNNLQNKAPAIGKTSDISGKVQSWFFWLFLSCWETSSDRYFKRNGGVQELQYLTFVKVMKPYKFNRFD